MKKISLGLIMWCLLAAAGQAADLPEPSGLVNDFTGRVDQTSLATLKAKVAQLKAQKDLEIGIAVVATTGGLPVEQYANQLARKWGVGSREANRGVLVVVALDDRTSRIEISRHFEGVLTDGQAGSILRAARPDFKAGQYGAGLIKIVDGIASLADTPETRAPSAKEKGAEGGTLSVIVGLVMLGVFLLAIAIPVVAVVALLIWAIGRAKSRGRGVPSGPTTAPNVDTQATSSSTYSAADYNSDTTSDDSSSSSDSSSTSDSSSSSDAGSSFGGSSDFGGGGASDSW
ncbi:MAG: TPM domain-containing protein [Pyrinomonadaceae bacterium]